MHRSNEPFIFSVNVFAFEYRVRSTIVDVMSVIHRLRKCWPSNSKIGTDDPTEQASVVQSNLKAISVSSSDTVVNESKVKTGESFLVEDVGTIRLPTRQHQLQLHAVGQEFKLFEDAALPELTRDDEILVRVSTIGLNPIDWKAPAFGWGLPSLPCILGRDFVGTVVQNSGASDVRAGSIVGVISTDYRDYRKAAFQEYAVAPHYNVYRIPEHYRAAQREIASLGVAFVTAALAFGVCLGGHLEGSKGEAIKLLDIARSIASEKLPEDIRDECANSKLSDIDRPKRGDWILIWGGGSTVGFVLVQLAKLAGLKVICVADAVKSGSVLVDTGVDVIVHRNDPEEAVKIIAGITKGKELRYGIDTVGKETANWVHAALHSESTRSKHIVGLVGLPKVSDDGNNVHQHKVPIKLFHEAPAIGTALTQLLEGILQDQRLILPRVHVHRDCGMRAVNSGLQLLRAGGFDGQRIVIPLR